MAERTPEDKDTPQAGSVAKKTTMKKKKSQESTNKIDPPPAYNDFASVVINNNNSSASSSSSAAAAAAAAATHTNNNKVLNKFQIKSSSFFKKDGEGSKFKIKKKKGQKFPVVLYQILSDPANHAIIRWLPHGRSWKVYNKVKMASDVCPKYFDHENYASFNRSVNGWGFKRITREGRDDCRSYYHERFLRGRPDLANTIPRLENQGKRPIDSNADPDLSKYKPMSGHCICSHCASDSMKYNAMKYDCLASSLPNAPPPPPPSSNNHEKRGHEGEEKQEQCRNKEAKTQDSRQGSSSRTMRNNRDRGVVVLSDYGVSPHGDNQPRLRVADQHAAADNAYHAAFPRDNLPRLRVAAQHDNNTYHRQEPQQMIIRHPPAPPPPPRNLYKIQHQQRTQSYPAQSQIMHTPHRREYHHHHHSWAQHPPPHPYSSPKRPHLTLIHNPHPHAFGHSSTHNNMMNAEHHQPYPTTTAAAATTHAHPHPHHHHHPSSPYYYPPQNQKNHPLPSYNYHHGPAAHTTTIPSSTQVQTQNNETLIHDTYPYHSPVNSNYQEFEHHLSRPVQFVNQKPARRQVIRGRGEVAHLQQYPLLFEHSHYEQERLPCEENLFLEVEGNDCNGSTHPLSKSDCLGTPQALEEERKPPALNQDNITSNVDNNNSQQGNECDSRSNIDATSPREVVSSQTKNINHSIQHDVHFSGSDGVRSSSSDERAALFDPPKANIRKHPLSFQNKVLSANEAVLDATQSSLQDQEE